MVLNRWSPAASLVLSAIALTVVAQQRNDGAKPASVVVRVASVSFVPAKFDLKGNADRLERAFRQAKSGGAEIAVAPEGALERPSLP